jgi:hypothetical protein
VGEEGDNDDDDAHSRISASNFKGDLSDIPKCMLFRMEECVAIIGTPVYRVVESLTDSKDSLHSSHESV